MIQTLLHRAILAEKPDIIIATPSKILAQLEAQNVELRESLESLVIDEADLILSYGYDEDVRKVLGYLPKIYQSYLMSATMSSVSTKDLVISCDFPYLTIISPF